MILNRKNTPEWRLPPAIVSKLTACSYVSYRLVGETGKVYANDISRRVLSTLRSRANRNELTNTEPLAMMEDIKLSLKPGAPVVIIDGDHDKIGGRSQHFLTKEQVIERVEEAEYELVRIETWLPRDIIFVFRPITEFVRW